MKLKLLYFAQFREAAGKSEENLEVIPGASVGEVLSLILKKYPVLVPFGKKVASAVNREVVPEDRKLKEGDEVAFLTPLSGG